MANNTPGDPFLAWAGRAGEIHFSLVKLLSWLVSFLSRISYGAVITSEDAQEPSRKATHLFIVVGHAGHIRRGAHTAHTTHIPRCASDSSEYSAAKTKSAFILRFDFFAIRITTPKGVTPVIIIEHFSISFFLSFLITGRQDGNGTIVIELPRTRSVLPYFPYCF